jgi:hypothetical protein
LPGHIGGGVDRLDQRERQGRLAADRVVDGLSQGDAVFNR